VAAPSPSLLWGQTTRRRALTIALTAAVVGGALLWAVQDVGLLVSDCDYAREPALRCVGMGLLRSLGVLLIPLLMIALLLYGLGQGVRVYGSFIEGAKEGFETAIKIIPYLVAILVAVAMLRASGALDAFIALLRPVVEPLGMPAETLPMALIRPLSGSGALGVMTETMKVHGPDSLIGLIVSTINGSMETTFYVVAVYFGAVRVTRVRATIAAGLLADLTGIVAAVFICRMMFG
jgi:spore maturation protein B